MDKINNIVFTIILIFVLAISISNWVTLNKLLNDQIRVNKELKLENEKLKNQEYKELNEILSNDFICNLYDNKSLILANNKKLSVVIAQAILESNYGNSELTRQSNNLFCIKGHYNNKCVYFQDDEVGLSKFKKYDNITQSLVDYLELMNTERYCDIWEYDYKKICKKLKERGYATHNEYSNKLIKIIETHNLTKLDEIT